jgi:uncharacterized membrane protein YkgB
MPCAVSCMISAIFIIGMIYFYNMTNKSEIVKQYKASLPMHLQKKYDEISEERKLLGFQGYGLGILISLFIIFYNLKIKRQRLGSLPLVCIVVATSFITNYFYYILSPKSDWMVNHLKDQAEIKAWLVMYREMQFNYHMGLVVGIIGVGILAFAFRC